LRADEMDVRVDSASGDDVAFARDDLGAGADRNRDRGLDVRVDRLADLPDAPVLDADVGLDDAPVIYDQRVRDHGVGNLRRYALALPHAVADHLAAAELHFLAVGRVVVLDPDPQVGVREPHAVPDRRSEHLGIRLPGDFHLSLPMTLPAKPQTLRSPASSTRSTLRQ